MAKMFSGVQSLSFPSTDDLRMGHPTVANRPFGGSLLYALDCRTRKSHDGKRQAYSHKHARFRHSSGRTLMGVAEDQPLSEFLIRPGTRDSERIQPKSSQNVSEKRFILTIG